MFARVWLLPKGWADLMDEVAFQFENAAIVVSVGMVEAIRTAWVPLLFLLS